jgi:uncharacterized protein (TIGR03435 family)
MRMSIDGPALAIVVAVWILFGPVFAQAPETRPTFEVVSIKRNIAVIEPGSRVNVVTWQPNGGLTMTNAFLNTILVRAHPDIAIVGLPAWASSERYDLIATSRLVRTVTLEERTSMLRALLADRFKLVTHVEKRRQPVYNLVLARADRRLGAGIKPSDVDCARIVTERNSAPPEPLIPAADFNAPLPSCTVRAFPAELRRGSGALQGSHLFEAEGTMDDLARMLRGHVDRHVVNQTALHGSYRVTVNFDSGSFDGAAGLPLTMFTAVQEQLGLRLDAAQADVDTLVVDAVERPTEN